MFTRLLKAVIGVSPRRGPKGCVAGAKRDDIKGRVLGWKGPEQNLERGFDGIHPKSFHTSAGNK